jgi:hypothetical protein
MWKKTGAALRSANKAAEMAITSEFTMRFLVEMLRGRQRLNVESGVRGLGMKDGGDERKGLVFMAKNEVRRSPAACRVSRHLGSNLTVNC